MFNAEQQQFIETHFKRTKTDKLIENMAKLKSFMPIMLMDRAKILDESDCFASMWEVSVDQGESYQYRCICGKTLKKRFLLRHRYKDIELSLGSSHYEQYCDIHIKDIERIVEEEEAYSKVKWEFEEKLQDIDKERLDILMEMESLPKAYREQLAIGLPLLDKQLHYLNREGRLIRGVRHIMEMDKALLTEIRDLDEERRSNIIIHLESGEVVSSIHDIRTLSYSQIRNRREDMDNTETVLEETDSTNASIADPSSINFIKGLGYIVTDKKPEQLTDKMMKFIGTVRDEMEQWSMMRNTLDGVYRITDLHGAKQLSPKFHRQGVLLISMSDRQYEVYSQGPPYDGYDWKVY